MKRITLLLSTLLAVAVATAAEDFRLATIFSDNMVLQREMPVPVWGWAAPGTQVTVDFAGQSKKAEAGKDGRWQVTLDPLKTNATGTTLQAKAGSGGSGGTLSLKDVLVGEVWIAAGQSNMTGGGPDRDMGIYPAYKLPANADKRPDIRLGQNFAGWNATLEPLADLDEDARGKFEWKTFKENPYPANVIISEAFARVLRDELKDVPVGMINFAVPGVSMTTWVERSVLEALPAKEDSGAANFYEEVLGWGKGKLEAQFKESGKETWQEFLLEWVPEMRHRRPSNEAAHFPSMLYNTRVAPLGPFAFRGAIWHQGEAGGPRGDYATHLISMYNQWRDHVGHKFHFIAGTLSRNTTHVPPLAPIRAGFYRSYPSDSIRAAAPKFREDGRADFVELYELGDWSVHFLPKVEMGRRMALAALNLAHGKNHLHSGPRAVDTRIEGRKATIRFDLVGDGLVFHPSINNISGIIVEDGAGNVEWANVKVTGKDTIEVSHPDIKEIKTLAYGEHINPHETLFNSAGLAASPFTVNPTRQPRVENSPVLLAFDEPELKQAGFHIGHLTNEGYMFTLRGNTRSEFEDLSITEPLVKVHAFIPADWKGFEIESKGKKIAATESTLDGVRTATFEAPPDGTWIIIAQPGKAESFRKIDRY